MAEAIAEAGLVGVRSADDEPVAVMQGYGFDLTWQQLNEAAIAIHRGAHWVATNTDPTRPTDRGLVPGNGAAVAAVAVAVACDPEVAGKPYRPLLDDTVARLGADRPIFVGDRLDTDIAGAVGAGLDSMLVLSGSHGARDLLAGPARPSGRPTSGPISGPCSSRRCGPAARRLLRLRGGQRLGRGPRVAGQRRARGRAPGRLGGRARGLVGR